MYDRSLDIFAPHRPPRLTGLYPYRAGAPAWDSVLGTAMTMLSFEDDWRLIPGYPHLPAGRALLARRLRHRRARAAVRRRGRRRGCRRRRDGRGRPANQHAQPQCHEGGERRSRTAREVEGKRRRAGTGDDHRGGRAADRAADELRRDRLLAAAPPDGRGRHGHDRVHRARLGHGLARLRPRRHPRPRRRDARGADEVGQGPHGPALPAALLPRRRQGRPPGRRQQRRREGGLGRSDPRGHRPRDGREPGPGLRASGGRAGQGLSRRRRAAARRSSSRWPRRPAWARSRSRSRPSPGRFPTASCGRSRSCRDGCTSSSRGSRRSRKGRRGSCGSTTWPRPTIRRGSTSSSSSRSTPSSSTGCSTPFPTSSTIPTSAPSRRSTGSSRRAS